MLRATRLGMVLSVAACGVADPAASTSVPGQADPTPVHTDDAPPPVSEDPPPAAPLRVAPGPDGCPFGELVDCEGWCAPDYLLGDGVCDDGVEYPATFDCPAYDHDAGDCDAPPPGATCTRVVRMHTGLWPHEVGWRIERRDGATIAQTTEGTYHTEHRPHHHQIHMEGGDYILVGLDAYGDGWNGGSLELVHPSTGEVFQSVRMNMGFRREWSFHVDCDPAPPAHTCQASVHTHSGAASTEVGWVLTDRHGLPLAHHAPGSLTPHSTQLHTQHLASGAYQLRAIASASGWQGGHVKVLQRGGRVAALALGTTPARRFSIDCARDGAPPIELPAIEVACATLTLNLDTGEAGPALGWSVISTPDWTRRFGAQPDTLPAHAIFSTGLRLHSGTWWFRLTHEGGLGWSNAAIWLTDDDDPNPLLELTLGAGHQLAAPVEVTCVDASVPTPPSPCEPGALPDCRDQCFPAVYLGDGFCDDGLNSAVDFNCEQLEWDAGDCLP